LSGDRANRIVSTHAYGFANSAAGCVPAEAILPEAIVAALPLPLILQGGACMDVLLLAIR